MQIVDKIKENPVKELTDEQTSDLFRSIVMGKDITEEIKTEKGVFIVKFPRLRDVEAIGRLTAFRLNGIPAHCFDADSYELMQRIATLDVITVSGPSWYELAKKEQPGFSWRDIPSMELINEVYAKAYQFRLTVQDKINGDTKTANRKVDDTSVSEKTSGPELFDGLSGSTGING